MTDTTKLYATEPVPLPGMADLAPNSGEVVEGVRRTIAQLAAESRISEGDAGKLALALAMGDVVDRKQRGARGLSTVGMDARVLLDILNDLAGDPDDVDGDLAATMAEWAEAIEVHTDASTAD